MVERVYYRTSLVRMFYASQQAKDNSKKSTSTPDPFLELRVFLISPIRLPSGDLRKIRMAMSLIIDNMVKRLIEFDLLKATEDGLYEFDTRTDDDTLGVVPITPHWKMQIDGFEVERIDENELRDKFFQHTPMPRTDKIELDFNKEYRYMAFFDPMGNIKWDYDEFEIRKLLKEAEIMDQQTDILKSITRQLDEITATAETIRSDIVKFRNLQKRIRDLK